MSFRFKLGMIIFAVGLIPALAVLIFSTYLLSSTLNRVGAAGLESSLQSADTLIDQTQTALGRLLVARLPDDRHAWKHPEDIEAWRKANNVDLAFLTGLDEVIVAISDSLPAGYFTIHNLVPKPGSSSLEMWPLEIGDRCLLVFTKKDTAFWGGCGILMPPGYGQSGKDLANSLSASASLGIFRTFSLKLLGSATIIAIIIAAGMGLLIATVISRQLVRPLEILKAGAETLGSGNLGHRVQIKSHDEFSLLADSFNRMADQISENQRRLLEAERLAAWREVARRIAHEIRNPLTPISVELYRLAEKTSKIGDEDSNAILKSLDAIKRQIEVLQDLASQFSTFAREPELKIVNCSLNEIAQDAINLFKGQDNLKIAFDFPDILPLLPLDPQMMNRVFGNLIKNSIEASPNCAEVTIRAFVVGEHVAIIFRDRGPGFPEEKLNNIDRPYITSKKGGTGLGLIIIKKIVEEHGGQVKFLNDSGAVVEMRFPLKVAP